MSLEANGMSIADVMSLANNGEGNNFFGGNGLWIFFLFFLMYWNNGNNVQPAQTTDVWNGLGQQDIFRNQGEIKQEIGSFERDAANRWGDIRYDMATQFGAQAQQLCQGFGTVNQNIAENRYASDKSACEINRNIDQVKYLDNQNKQDIIAASDRNAQRILDVINQNQIQTLRDELSSTRAALSNNVQTQAILGQLQPVPRPAYITGSPYAAQSYNGYGV